jgi:hypothetical protein
MSSISPHVGDVLIAFVVTAYEDDNVTPYDISTATEKVEIFTKPDLTQFERAGSFVTNGKDGKIRYYSALGELDVEGDWRVQGRYSFADGRVRHTDLIGFVVLAND